MKGQPVLGADLNCSETGGQRLTACGPMSEYSSMSGLAPQADLHFGSPLVSHVPTGDITPFHSITSSARASSVGGIVEAERLGGLEIDDEIEFGRLLDRDIGGLRARAESCRHNRRRAGTGPGSLVHRT